MLFQPSIEMFQFLLCSQNLCIKIVKDTSKTSLFKKTRSGTVESFVLDLSNLRFCTCKLIHENYECETCKNVNSFDGKSVN